MSNKPTYHDYKKEETRKLAESMVDAGYRAYIAEGGTYGYFTDGKKVVSFQYDLCGFKYGGNYVTSDGHSCGTGWRLDDNDSFSGLISQTPPYWTGVQNTQWHYTSLEEHRKQFQRSSKYKEVIVEKAMEV